jgi:uncharacterized membrane protein YesL
MGKLFRAESKLWTYLNFVADAIILNLIWLVTSIPIITVGASTTAYYYTTHKVLRNQRSSLLKEYFSSFKANFVQATKTWLLFLVLFVVFYYDITQCADYLEAGAEIGALAYVFVALEVLALVWCIYVFAYMARFENKTIATLKNGVFMMFLNPLSTLQVLAMLIVAVYALYQYWALILFVPAAVMVGVNMILEKVFRKYMTPEELAEEEENDKMRKR